MKQVAEKLEKIIQKWSNSNLLSYAGYFPDDFYGKEGEKYWKAVKEAAREIKSIIEEIRRYRPTPLTSGRKGMGMAGLEAGKMERPVNRGKNRPPVVQDVVMPFMFYPRDIEPLNWGNGNYILHLEWLPEDEREEGDTPKDYQDFFCGFWMDGKWYIWDDCYEVTEESVETYGRMEPRLSILLREIPKWYRFLGWAPIWVCGDPPWRIDDDDEA